MMAVFWLLLYPGYYIRIDLAAEGVKRVYANESDSLAYYMASFFKNGYKSYRINKNLMLPIKAETGGLCLLHER
jgi:cell division protein FtsI (penicillin-binding protein 3)